MTRAALSSSLAEGIAEVRRSTDDLLRAVQARDEQRIQAALDRRAASIDALEPQIREHRREHGPAFEQELKRQGAALAAGAEIAERELRRMLDESRNALLRWLREARAIRTYETAEATPSVLDRSG